MIWGMAPTTLVLLHGFTNTGASWDEVAAALGGTLPARGARHPRPRQRSGSPAGDADRRDRRRRRRWRRRRLSWRATRWAGGSPSTWRWPCRERVRRLVLIGASPGDRRRRRPAARAAPPTSGSPTRSSAMTIEAVRRALGADAGAGRPAGGRAGRRRTPTGCRNTPPAWPRRCAGWAPGRCRRCGSGSDELTMPVELIVGERDAKFRATAERDGGGAAERTGVVVAGRRPRRPPGGPGGGGGGHRERRPRRYRTSRVDRSPSPGPSGGGDRAAPRAAADQADRRTGPASPARRRARAGSPRPRAGRPRSPAGHREWRPGTRRSRRRGPGRPPRSSRRCPPQRAIFRHTRSAAARVERAGIGGRLVERQRNVASARAARGWLRARAPAPRTAPSRPAPARAVPPRPRRADQAPLASILIAICGPANARTAASRPASSPIATFTLTVPKPRCVPRPPRARRRSGRRRDRPVDRRRRGRRRPPSSRHTGSRVAAPRQVPQRQIDRGERLGEHGRLGAPGQHVGDRRDVRIALQDGRQSSSAARTLAG